MGLRRVEFSDELMVGDSSEKGYPHSDFSVLKGRIKVALIPVIEMSGR